MPAALSYEIVAGNLSKSLLHSIGRITKNTIGGEENPLIPSLVRVCSTRYSVSIRMGLFLVKNIKYNEFLYVY